MFSHILVPLDGSKIAECVLPHLAAIARTGSPQVTLVQVLETGDANGNTRPVDAFDWQIRKAEAETYLKDVCGRLGELGFNAVDVVLDGKAAETVIKYAHDHQVDFILLSSHGKSGLSGWNVSGVVQKIIFRARTSIMVVRAYQPSSAESSVVLYKRIMIPLDGSARAEVVLTPASILAKTFDSELVAVTVIQRPTIPRRMPPSEEDMLLMERLVDRNRAEAYAYLSELQARVGVHVENRLQVDDSAVSALHRIVDEEGADLVILSAHGYSGEARWPYGSVVVSFISYGTTPLIIIQDLPPDRIEPSKAEITARELGRR